MINKSDTQIFDMNACEVSERNGTYGGMAGLKEGVIWNDKYWLIKYPKTTIGAEEGLSYTLPLTEYIGSKVYEILGYDVHTTCLAERHRKIVVACEDFCKNVGDLREFRTLKNIYNEELSKRLKEVGKNLSHTVNLEEIMIHLEHNPVLSKIEGLKERFWECAVIDGIIKNNDRNNGNWGLLYENREYKIAPIFDNGASFSNKISDDRIASILANSDEMLNNALNAITTYERNGKQLNFKSLLALDFPELERAILRVTPLFIERLELIKEMINEIPSEYKGIAVCSNIKKEFYIIGMEMRIKELLEPVYNILIER